MKLYDRIFKPRQYMLPNGKVVEEKFTRLPLILLILLAAAAFGLVYSSLLAVACVNFKADQTLVGTAMNLLGTAAAIGFYSMRRRSRGVCLAVNNIPLTNADIITGVSMMLLFVFAIGLFNASPISQALGLRWRMGFGTLLIAHITFDAPYVILSVMPKLRQLDPNIYEAAQDLGASGLYAFRRVILPEILPGVLNGMIIAFTMSIDDFVVSFFTTGSGVSNLSITIYTMAKRGISPKINALSTIIFACVFILLIGINLQDLGKDGRSQKKVDQVRIPY